MLLKKKKNWENCQKRWMKVILLKQWINLTKYLMSSIGTLTRKRDSPGDAVVKNPPANAGDKGLSPGLGRSHMPQSN